MVTNSDVEEGKASKADPEILELRQFKKFG